MPNFSRLSFWNKLGIYGSIASIIAIPLAFYLATPSTDNTKATSSTSQTAGHNSIQIGSSNGPITIYSPPSSPPSPSPSSSPTPPNNLLDLIARPRRGLRHIELYLGTPIEETNEYRIYEKFGYRFSIFGIQQDKWYESIEIGPLRDQPLLPINLSGPWGNITKSFGELTISEISDATMCLKVVDWNYGGNAPCMNVIELQCGGAQYQSGLYIRTGLLYGCHYNEFNQEVPSPDNVLKSMKSSKNVTPPKITADYLFENPHLLDTSLPIIAKIKINYITITPYERQAPRGEEGF